MVGSLSNGVRRNTQSKEEILASITRAAEKAPTDEHYFGAQLFNFIEWAREAGLDGGEVMEAVHKGGLKTPRLIDILDTLKAKHGEEKITRQFPNVNAMALGHHVDMGAAHA
ncbi:TPA: hypothetical protein DHW58_01805 [Patescibacteria group bacterium]|uniref:Uncharacterized protein n=2 Tax=Bacteria division Kazan-3B-28 TaxID=1798534 RepID=A0A0G2A3Q2_UNCK3|nr:MAG: hypothetical protein VE98_C0001G0191 [candidate division Kazan bacterium GW2011_GWA1_50_15]KKW25533.1 MAG: hypothetical protein VE99_C0001G0170 [candidate division Kazan bacterium GW2011_GWC1_52_13]KKW26839.1 MAG: hypothetical protein VF00_C0002G0164 [candidate division Kazan bacterium GW2011_GWB1_52_7]HAV65832.1 hypothetical protein [Patescibacteria group bacterium]HCL47705.1 hypothetical protein [Patescibacteria group bacterium]